MKKMNQAGFSLVELMVVVAIIGVLATVAIPRVNKFIAKARTSEAQTNLSSIYTFNKNFFVEFQGYTSNLNALGYQPEGNLRYNSGFGANFVAANYAALGKPTPTAANINTLVLCPTTATAVCKTLVGATGSAPATPAAGMTATATTFTASASANLVSATADVWTIDQSKFMTNTSDGT